MQGIGRSRLGEAMLGDVIVAVDGQPVTCNDDLLALLEMRGAGESVSVICQRGARELRYAVELQLLE